MNLITLLFVAIVIILVSHTYCGCRNPYALIEGMDDAKENSETDKKGNTNKEDKKSETDTKKDKTTNGLLELTEKPAAGYTNMTEGFTGLQRSIGQYVPYDLATDSSIDTSTWNAPNMVVTPGQPINPDVQKFLSRPKQPIPLPEGELDMFFNTPFKPECCPNTYSNSQGCACMTSEQYNFLILRGMNNVPYSEY